MAKLYYGNGDCNVEGSNIRGVEIRYRGAIEIEDKTSDAFVIGHQNNGILIFPLGEGFLNELFSYVGEFKIISVIVADENAERVSTSVIRVMDYTELLTGNTEDMTVKSEDMSATYIHSRKIIKTMLKQPYIENLHTSGRKSILYLENGNQYDGYYHIHLEDSAAMTGNTHTPSSQDLYYKQIKGGEVIDKLVPTKTPSHGVPGNRLKRRRRR